MTKAVLLLPALLVLVSGCVVTYEGIPNTALESLPKNHEPKPLSYYVESFDDSPPELILPLIMPSWYPLMMRDFREKGIGEVRHTLETNGMFSELIQTNYKHLRDEEGRIPYDGTHLNIALQINPPSGWAMLVAWGQGVACVIPPLCIAAAVGAVPYYSGEGGLAVAYMLYREGRVQKTYRYTIRKKGVGGILFLPFAWLNFFTNDLKDALRETTIQFLIDAQRDGNL